MSQSELTIKISANINDFNKKIEAIQKNTEDLNETLNKAGLAAGVTFAALATVTTKVVGEFKDAQKSSLLLENSLKNQGIYTEKLANGYKEMAKELGKLTNTDDDAIIKGQAILQRFIGQNEISKELTLQTINLAKAQGIDLDSAFSMVGKTIGGEVNPLSRQLGITLDKNASITEKLELVTSKLEGKVGGVAEAMAKAEGPAGALVVAFGNLQENLGEKLKPVFDGVADSLLKFTDYLSESEGTLTALAGLIATGLSFSGLIILVAGAAKAFIALEVAAAALSVSVITLTGGLAAVGAVLGLIAVKYVASTKAAKEHENATRSLADAEQELADLKKKNVSGLASEEISRRNRIRDLEKEIPLLKEAAKAEKEKALQVTRLAQGEYEAAQKRKQLEEKEKASEKEREANEKRLADAKELSNQLIDAGKDELSKLEDLRDRRIKIAMDDKNLLLQIEKDFQDAKYKLEEENSKKLNDLRKAQGEYEKKQAEDRLKLINAGASNPFSLANMEWGTMNDKEKTAAGLGAGAGVLNQVSNGAAGAKTLVTEAAAMGVDMFAPGLGQAMKPLLGALTGGPEATREFVKSFTDAIPDLIEGIITAIPVLIEEFANQTPVIIERLAEKAPKIIESLIQSAPKVMIAMALQAPKMAVAFIKEIPNIVTGFIDALIEGAGDFIQALVDEITGVFEDLFDMDSGGIPSLPMSGASSDPLKRIGRGVASGGLSEVPVVGGVVNDIFDSFGFAEGGEFAKQVPAGFPNDSFPARLQSGELVVDQTTSAGLKEMVKNNKLDSSGDINTSLLNKILTALEMPMTIETSVSVKEKAFADIILQLNRNNARLA